MKGKSEGEGNEGNLKGERGTLGFVEGAGKTGGKGICTLLTGNFFEFPFLLNYICLLLSFLFYN